MLSPTPTHPFEDEVGANGFFPALFARVFGKNTERLSERLQPAHWLSYVLILAQSATVALVFGHAEVSLVFSPALAIRIIASLGLFILVATVVASDMAMLRTIQRIPALARNRQRWALREHVAYTLFVLLTEAATLGVVLSVLDADPTALVSSRPLIAPDSVAFQLAIVLRVLLVAWTSVQLIIVRGKLPVLLSTLNATAREILGAHVERKLAGLRTEHVNLRAGYRTYANMSKPPRRMRTWWNGWLVRRELAHEAEEERQVSNVLAALEELERHLPQDGALGTGRVARSMIAEPSDGHPTAPYTGAGIAGVVEPHAAAATSAASEPLQRATAPSSVPQNGVNPSKRDDPTDEDPDPTPPKRTQDPSDRASPDEEPDEAMRPNVRRIPPFTVVPTRTSVRADTGRSRRVSEETRQKRLEVAREILTTNRTIGVRELGRRIALATKHRISLSTVSTIRTTVLAELERERRTVSAVRS